MKFVFVITARGGSKRLPGKNIKEFCGKPLIAYSIEYAFKNMPESEVFVTTDSPEIEEVSLKYGAKVIKRPAKLAGDYATSSSVMQHAAEYLVKEGCDFDFAVLLQPTNPIRPDGMLAEAIKIIEKGEITSLFSVSKLVKKLGRIREEKYAPYNYKLGQRSQDIEPLYYENGLLYITSKSLLLEGEIYNQSSYPFVVKDDCGDIDIDDLNDFQRAEAYYKLTHE